MKGSYGTPWWWLLLLATCCGLLAGAAAAATKWTVLVYMLADNDLEQFGLLDLEEIMVGMSAEPLSGCSFSACNAGCPDGAIPTYTSACTGGAPGTMARCCPGDTYPDVLLLVDRGSGMTTSMLYEGWAQHADYSILTSQWTTAWEFLALPGGQWQMLKDHSELNMADPAVLASFLRGGLDRFPPTGDRKYMLVLWDHGSGWSGYGADHTCAGNPTYSQNTYCGIFNLQRLAQGLRDGLQTAAGAPVKLDILGFDACLMSMYEVAAVLSPFTDTLLGSELLEPGHGWDYSLPLQAITQRVGVANEDLQATGLSTKDLGAWAISGYMAQAGEWGTSGVTLALVNTSLVHSSLEPAMDRIAAGLRGMLNTTAAFSMQVLQKRSAMGEISGAEENVDLGSLLLGLSSSITQTTAAATTTKAQLQAARAAYDQAILSYRRDNTLFDGTGMAIYFPSSAALLDGYRYAALVNTDSPALSGWMGFLHTLYSATAAVAAASKGPFKFVEPYAVPYQDSATKAWITHGTITTPMGLSADMLYGFVTPTGSELIIAGNKAALLDSTTRVVIGSWSGLMFGLLQDLTPGDAAVDGLALAYADEQHVTDASGAMAQYVLQVQVLYAASCYDAVKDMKRGMIKYVLDMKTQESIMQLFVSSPGSTSWGEIPSAQGGVVIPFLGSVPLTGATSTAKAGASFGYADCLKWGYADTLKMMAFNAAQAAGVLGLDLTRDMVTQLVVQSFDGNTTGITGFFEPAQKTLAGCQCSQRWEYQDSAGVKTTINGTCITDTQGTWCVYEPGSCGSTAAPAAPTWDLCTPATTLSGCKCHRSWSFGGTNYHGTCADDADPRGTWCVVDRATCPTTFRAHGFGAGNLINAAINGVTATLTGLDFDYCQTTTSNACHCSGSWAYNGTTYNGVCRAGLLPGLTVPGIEADTQWCQVDTGCRAARSLDGYSYDTCSPSGGRVTTSGARCALPAVYNGISLYDCISYNHSAPGNATDQPWCFTDIASGAWGSCKPWTCSEAVEQFCPSPGAGGLGETSDLTGWAAPKCLESLCDARQALVNISQCGEDSQAQRDNLVQQHTFLAASPAFCELLQESTGSGSLSAYCATKFGELCVDNIIDPACPALFRVNNKWRTTNNTALLCQTGCLTAMCRLQEWAKADTTGTPKPAGAYSCADSELETLVRWVLMQQMDAYCQWPGPASLACNRLLSPPQLCAAETALGDDAGTISDGSPPGGMYSASSVCSWTVSSLERPYLSLNFKRFDTEQQYDMVTVEDFEGLIGMFSGSDVPSTLTTDTGLMRVNFTADGTVQKRGFSATWLATSLPQTQLPTCTGNSKLLQVVLRSRQYGAELSWVITSSLVPGSTTPNQFNIVMAGGLLPASVKPRVPAAVAAAADGSYKDFRSYYSYACLPTGRYHLQLFDSYGDGWNGGRLSLTQMVNATTGCPLLLAQAPDKFNKTVAFALASDADTSSAACSSLTSTGSQAFPYFLDLGLVLMAEDTRTFILAKQRKIKEALALLLDVDASQVSIQSISNASVAQVACVALWGNKSAASSYAAGATPGGAGGSDVPVEALSGRQLLENAAISRTQQMTIKQAAAAAAAHDSRMTGDQLPTGSDSSSDNQHFLAGRAGLSSASKAQLARLAVPVSELASALQSAHRQLLEAQEQLARQQGTAQAGATAGSAGAESATGECSSHGMACSGDGLPSCGSAAACRLQPDDSLAGDDTPGPEAAGQQPQGRQLQQLLVLNQQGQWQNAFAASAAAHTTGASPGDGSSGGLGGIAALLAADPLSAAGVNGSAAVAPQLAPLLQPRASVAAAPLPKPSTSSSSHVPAAVRHVALASNFRSAFSPSEGGDSGDSNSDVFVAAEGEDALQAHAAADNSSSSAKGADSSRTAPRENVQAEVTISGEEMLTDIDAVRPGRSLMETEDGQQQAVPAPGAAAAVQRPGRAAAAAAAAASRVGVPGLPLDVSATAMVVDGELLTELDAIAPGRSLIEGSPAANAGRQARPNGRSKQRHETAPATGRSRAADLQPSAVQAAAEFARAGKQGPGRRHKPSQQQQQQQQGMFRLMGPKTAAARRRAAAGPAAAATGLVPQPWLPAPPVGLTDSSPAAGAGRGDAPARQLLASAGASPALLVVARVSGFRTRADADAAAASLQQLVANGTLRSTLAAQGWPGVVLGLQFTEVGRIPLFWSSSGQLRRIIIAAAVAGSVAFVAAVLVGWWVRRSRRRGAAQVPAAGAGAGGQQAPRLSAVRTGRPVTGTPAAGLGGCSSNSSSPRASLLGGGRPGSPGGSPFAAPGGCGYAPLGSFGGAPPAAGMSPLSAQYPAAGCGAAAASAYPCVAGMHGFEQQQLAAGRGPFYAGSGSPRASPWVGDPRLQQQQQQQLLQQQHYNGGDATVVIAARISAIHNPGQAPQQQRQQQQ